MASGHIFLNFMNSLEILVQEINSKGGWKFNPLIYLLAIGAVQNLYRPY